MNVVVVVDVSAWCVDVVVVGLAKYVLIDVVAWWLCVGLIVVGLAIVY
jgi:hypothetical protein